MPNLPYRSDIDGLRALAVLLVVGFHAFPSLLPGGFIGVDLFFVISGYLISSILYQGLSSQNFSFLTFYGRRIRRIFPALIVVLLACYAFGWFALFADEYALLGKHMAGGAGFVANYLLWFEAGYFDSAADTKPLLHLWSLGIEEQFYLVWPFVLWVIYYCGQKYPKAQSFTNPLLLTIGIAILSFVLNIRGINVRHDLVATFYSAQTRFWELLFGAILAYVTLFPKAVDKPGDWVGRSAGRSLSHSSGWFGDLKERFRIGITTQTDSYDQSSPRYQSLQSIVGLGLIALGALLITPKSAFPGWWALLPTVGAVLLIHAGPKAFINRSLLSNKGMVWIGLISYPLYLWHWPILSLLRIIESETPAWHYRLVAVVLAFVLATLTYLLIEKPIRYGFKSQSQAAKAKWQQYVTGILVILMIAVGYVGWNTYEREGLGERKFIKPYSKQLADLKFTLQHSQGWLCNDARFINDMHCYFEAGAIPTAVVIGDSHSPRLYVGLQQIYKEQGIDLANFGGGGGCPPFLNLVSKKWPGKDYNLCVARTSRALESVINNKTITHVILINRGPVYTEKKGFGDIDNGKYEDWVLHIDGEQEDMRSNTEAYKLALTRTLLALQKAGKQVIYLHNTPELGFEIRNCIEQRPFHIKAKKQSICAIPKSVFLKRNSEHRELVNSVLNQFPKVRSIDLSDATCDEEFCYGIRDGVVLYTDGDHLSKKGSEYIAHRLKKQFFD